MNEYNRFSPSLQCSTVACHAEQRMLQMLQARPGSNRNILRKDYTPCSALQAPLDLGCKWLVLCA